MPTPLTGPPDASLRKFGERDATVRFCKSILTVIPFAPPLHWYGTLEQALDASHPDLDSALKPELLAAAEEILCSKPFQDVLWAAESLDTSDRGISLYTGVRTAFSFFFGDRARAFDTDAQQRADAALKALGIAYIVHRLFDGAVLEQIDRLLVLPAGRALLVYYGAIEVAMPFTSEVLTAGEHFVSGLVRKYATGSTLRLSPVAGEEGVEAARGTLPYLIDLLDRVTYHSVTHLDAITSAARKFLPRAFTKGDNLPGLVATGADAIPVYELLVARLAAEAALWLARERVDAGFPSRPIAELAVRALPGAPDSAAGQPDPFTEAHSTPSADASSPGNPFAQPAGDPAPDAPDPYLTGEATPPRVAAEANPFAAPAGTNPLAAPAGANPFAAPTDTAGAAPQAQPANPFAAPAGAAGAALRAQPTKPFGTKAPAPAERAPQAPDDPTAAGPGEPLHGSYLRRDGGREYWLIFTQDGLFTDSPPASLAPVDWQAHAAAGHQVGRYHRRGNQLTIRSASGQLHTLSIEKQTYALIVDGAVCRMADYDLTGRALLGTWRSRDGRRALTFSADGALASAEGVGRYALGPREITLDTGTPERLPFLSDLKPHSRTPDVIYIGGIAYDRVDDGKTDPG